VLNKIVVHYLDSRLLKGTTSDFTPDKQLFHLVANETNKIHEIDMNDIKAIYFVRTYEGSPDHKEDQDVERTGLGKKIKVLFKDGEVLFGYARSYSEDKSGFSVIPVDPKSNNEMIFINRNATDEVTFVGEYPQEKEPDNEIAEEDMIVLCPSCGIKNRIKTSRLEMKPRCGKCKT
jgi:hypothetical protein